jgi:hypothetical protein
MDQMPSKATSGRRGRRAPFYRYSRFWFSLAVSSALISTTLMLFQSPRDPYDSQMSADAWLRPTYPGRVRQMDTLRADLNGVAISNDGKTIWVAGNAGLIAVSTDDGDHWQKEAISDTFPASVPAATLTAISETASATSTADATRIISAPGGVDSTNTTGTISPSSLRKKH